MTAAAGGGGAPAGTGAPIRLRASKAGLWLECPAAGRRLAETPETESGPAAQRGTAIHALAQWAWETWRTEAPSNLRVYGAFGDLEARGLPDGAAGDLEAATIAARYLEHALEVARWLESAPDHMFCEEPGEIRSAGWHVTGTADFYIAGLEEPGVLDLKTGRQHVAADSPQLRVYAALFGAPGRSVVVGVHQDGETRLKSIGADERQRIAHQVREAAAAAAAGAPARAGPHCDAHWCPFRGDCAAYAGALRPVPGLVVDPAAPVPVVRDGTSLEALSLEQLAEIKAHAPAVKAWIEAATAAFDARIRAGEFHPGWTVGKGRASWRVADRAALERYAAAVGVPAAELWEPPEPRSAAQVRAAFKRLGRPLPDVVPDPVTGAETVLFVNTPGAPAVVPREGAGQDAEGPQARAAALAAGINLGE